MRISLDPTVDIDLATGKMAATKDRHPSPLVPAERFPGIIQIPPDRIGSTDDANGSSKGDDAARAQNLTSLSARSACRAQR